MEQQKAETEVDTVHVLDVTNPKEELAKPTDQPNPEKQDEKEDLKPPMDTVLVVDGDDNADNTNKDNKDDDDDKKQEKEEEEPTQPTTESIKDKLGRCLKARMEPPTGTKDPEVEEGEMLVGFLNCHLFEGTYVGTFYKKIVYEDRMRAEAIVRYITHSKATVFMLAEVWSGKIRDSIIKGVQHEYPHSYFPKCGGFGKLDSGLVFLSKKPIVKAEFKPFNDLSGWDRGSTKGVACIITEDRTAYFSTHFNAGGSPEAKRCRNRNIEDMYTFFDTITAKENITKAVVTGDLNARESDFDELQHFHNTVDDEEMLSYMTNPRQDYMNIKGLMEGSGRGLVDGLREKYSDHLEEPCITADHMYNSLAVLWTPGDRTRSRLDYFFIKGFDVRDSGAYFHWWAGDNADDESRRKEAFVMAFEGPKKERLVPVSDHYGIWIVLKPMP